MEENRLFTTFDTVSVLALMMSAAVLITTIVTGALSDNKNIQARRHADEIAARLIVSGAQWNDEASQGESPADGRAPASALPQREPTNRIQQGNIGLDPWGSPYQYRIYNAVDGDVYVSVVSGGPNGVIETRDVALSSIQLHASAGLGPKKITFLGDDVGVIQRRSQGI